ncbi:MAG TPA: hypothetical protein VE870_15115 [Bacteroidales bacterium]|nr:hypothetical protein [Bacteroidales bacterium]
MSKELVSLEYREQLQRDLARATVCRFLVAYVSLEGLDSIGRHLLSKALRDERSFGVSSLTCSCGYEPLLKLQEDIGSSAGVRLKYFMDPLVHGSDGPIDIGLFHSKLIYLLLARDNKSVVYIGSHNWSQRALGPGRPRNVEASLRFEMEFTPEHIEGMGSSMASEVNRHLIQAYNMPACLPAVRAYEATFEQWYQKGCRRASLTPIQQVTVVLAVRKYDGTKVTPVQWQGLTGRGIYMQVLEEGEGQQIWQAGNRILLLVWNSEADLRAGNQPILLRCRETTHKAGPNSQLRGTNQSPSPIAGFEAIIFDVDQLSSLGQSLKASRSSVAIWSNRTVQIYDLEFPTQRTDSSQVDAGKTPRYQFYLEVEQVVFPAEGDWPDNPNMVWARESFAVAKTKNSARYEEIPGYHVPAEVETEILKCLKEVLLVDPNQMKTKVLPVSSYDRAKVGKRVSAHPLHETYIGSDLIKRRDEFYLNVSPGFLVAEIDDPHQSEGKDRRPETLEELKQPVERVQRVFTTPLDELEKNWMAAARNIKKKE